MSDYRIQSVLFDANKNTLQNAIEFLHENNFKSSKVDVTDEFLRFRQYEPSYLKKQGFTEYRTITIDENKNIKYIVVYKRKNVMVGGLLVTESDYI
jgi:hypothetical protein